MDFTLRTTVKMSLMQHLYVNVVMYSNKELREIVAENNKLAGENYAYGSIKYKDRIYEAERPEYFEYRFVKTYPPMHIDIEKRMEKYVKIIEDIEKERPIADRFLVILFNFVKHVSELDEILGATLSNLIKPRSLNFCDEPNTPQDVQAFKKKFSTYITMLNERYMDNVLMTGEYNDH